MSCLQKRDLKSEAVLQTGVATFLRDFTACVSITHITRDTEICSDCPWQGHPSTREPLGTAELKHGIRCRRT